MTTPTALFALLSGAAGCFFTDPINQAPHADVQVVDQGPFHRGDTVRFSAAKSYDPDGEAQALEVSWTARLCNAAHTDCDPAFIEGLRLALGEPFEIAAIPDRREDGSITEAMSVEAEVVDAGQAREQSWVFVDVLNRPPALVLQPEESRAARGNGYPVGTPVRVVAGGSDPDGDALVYEWRYTPAAGSTQANVGWERLEDDRYELTPDVIGTWRVQVTATDPLGASITEETALYFGEDRPPCIGTTSPPATLGPYIIERGAPVRRFSVLDVEDDLDLSPPPLVDEGSPLGSARFRWLLGTPDTGGALVPIPGYEAASYQVDVSPYAPGDMLVLRVEIDDRQGRTLPCSEEDDTCSLESNTCMQRVTWSMQAR